MGGGLERGASPVAVFDPGHIVARLGDPETREAARAELLDWIRGLAPGRAALWLHLAASLDRLPAEPGLAAARAVLQADGGGEGAATEVGADTGTSRQEAGEALGLLALEQPPAEQAVLLALAARILDPVDAGSALFLRQRYLALAAEGPEGSEGPGGPWRPGEPTEPGAAEGAPAWDGPEAAEVVLSAAQALLAGVDPAWHPPLPSGVPESSRARASVPPANTAAADPGASADAASRREEALRILETFLGGDPMHPLAPEARRLRAAALGRNEGTNSGGSP